MLRCRIVREVHAIDELDEQREADHDPRARESENDQQDADPDDGTADGPAASEEPLGPVVAVNPVSVRRSSSN